MSWKRKRRSRWSSCRLESLRLVMGWVGGFWILTFFLWIELPLKRQPRSERAIVSDPCQRMGMSLELPHTKGCLVCGRDNPHGMYLTSHVDPGTGIIQAHFTTQPHHIGFENLIHGGVLATVLDEVMVWCAIWASKRACVAAEMSLRFVRKVGVGQRLSATATVTRHRSRVIETSGVLSEGGQIVCIATGKYVPLRVEETAEFWKTFVEEVGSREAVGVLRGEVGNAQHSTPNFE